MKILIFFFFVLFVGCGKKEVVTEVVEPVAEAKPIEPVAEVKPVEVKQPEVKKEIKPIEPVADAKAKPDGVNIKESKVSEGIRYLKDSDTPYTGKVFTLFGNGQKLSEGNWKDGKKEGLSVVWHENGQKKLEGNYKDGEMYGLWTLRHENGQKAEERNYKDGEVVKGSAKYWNSKGEPVDSGGNKLKQNNP